MNYLGQIREIINLSLIKGNEIYYINSTTDEKSLEILSQTLENWANSPKLKFDNIDYKILNLQLNKITKKV